MMSERSIVHMDLDTFFVSCERLIDSRLVGKPILVGGTSDRGVVASCSYEARLFGIHSAMPIRMAKQLCPEAIVLRGNTAVYTQYSESITQVIKEMVPVYEKTSIDEFYIDLTGMDRFFKCHQFTLELKKRILKETGLPISFGLSINKTVSKIATGEAKPNNQLKIDKGTEKIFLAPLSVRKIPMVGDVTYKSLCDLGMKKIKMVQEIPINMMASVLGKKGISIWKKANGIDHSPVIQYQERKSISTERTFDKDTTDLRKLESIISVMTENLIYKLRTQNKLTACITLKIRYSDFQTYTLQRRIPYSAADHKIIPLVKELYKKLYKRRLLVRLIGVKFSHLLEGGHQIELFDHNDKIINLYQAMDKIRKRYGDRAIMRAIGIENKKTSRKH
ncbi:DNA polymerase IV [Tenacibaculum sp. C7A-26P2]|uniref:DNA polymerase IV n=1 Tax=Tenacibaculum sp. C7A-26P2 TaxID=3447504 RepID=UPI003F82B299